MEALRFLLLALLRARKEINEKPTSLLLDLPNELLLDIVGNVVTFSMAYFCKIKLSCKDFLNASTDHYVYQHASLDKFHLIPLAWFTDENETTFLRRCRESGNLEII